MLFTEQNFNFPILSQILYGTYKLFKLFFQIMNMEVDVYLSQNLIQLLDSHIARAILQMVP
jgi:hypothetical protein